LRPEVVGGDLEGLIHALTDRHAGYNDDELGETISFIHLEDRLGVDVGLAGAGFHLHAKTPPLDGGGQGQFVPPLDGVHIANNRRLVNPQSVPHAELVLQGHLGVSFRDGKGRADFLAAGKEVADGVDGIGLELLVGEF